MYKGKTASMQRGAGARNGSRMSKEVFMASTRISLARSEVGHFCFGNLGKEQFVEKMRPFVKQMALNGFRKPRDVARLLNKRGLRTASGSQWSPRLAWFLLSFLYTRAAHPKSSEVSRTSLHTASPAKISYEQMAARLSERFIVVEKR